MEQHASSSTAQREFCLMTIESQWTLGADIGADLVVIYSDSQNIVFLIEAETECCDRSLSHRLL